MEKGRNRRAQVSFEYLLIVSFSLILVSSAGFFAFLSYQGFSDSLTVKQAQQAAQSLTDAAELVSAYGEPTFVTVTIFVPKKTTAIDIQANEVTFEISTSRGYTDVTAYAGVNLTGAVGITPGKKKVIVTAGVDDVSFG